MANVLRNCLAHVGSMRACMRACVYAHVHMGVLVLIINSYEMDRPLDLTC